MNIEKLIKNDDFVISLEKINNAFKILYFSSKDISDIFFCPKYEINIKGTMEEICSNCKNDPQYKQLLFIFYLAKSRNKLLSSQCKYRSNESVGEIEKKCCGGKIKKLEKFNCSKLNKEINIEDCCKCINHSTLEDKCDK